MAEHREVALDVQCDAVEGPPPAVAHPHGPHADRSDLARRGASHADPNPGIAVMYRRLHSQVAQGADHDLLDATHVLRAGPGAGVEGDDGIGDQLPRTVVGDVTPAVGTEHGRPDRCRVVKDVRRVGTHPERVDARVLEQQQVVVGRATCQGVLEVERLGVGDQSEAADAQHG